MNEKMNEGLSQPPGEAGRGAGLGSCVQPPGSLRSRLHISASQAHSGPLVASPRVNSTFQSVCFIFLKSAFKKFIYLFLFILLCCVLVAGCGI